MIEMEKPNIECTQLTGNYGKFVVTPLERGYGTTLGNSLRRILLSSLPGAAVTSIKIEGVQHEFSTVPGVKEDVTEIIMNIKNLCKLINLKVMQFIQLKKQKQEKLSRQSLMKHFHY